MARCRLLEVGRRELGDVGLDHHIGLRQLGRGDGVAHDGEGLQQHVDGVAQRRLCAGRVEMSTAITMSAPRRRATLTGTGLTRPPSTYSRPEIRTGWNTPGTLLEARTAMPVSPRSNTIDLAALQVGGHHRALARELLERAVLHRLVDELLQRLALEDAAVRQRPVAHHRLLHVERDALQLEAIVARTRRGRPPGCRRWCPRRCRA